MSHPPIPTKDALTIYAGKGARRVAMFNLRAKYECHFPASIAVYDPPDAWRPVLSAYYEVQWRKRAERWLNVASYRAVMDKSVKSVALANAEKEVCWKNARDWRAWGESK